MTVKELIEKLQQVEDKNARVVVRGYEGGVDEADGIRECTIALEVNEEWYYGKHEVQDEYRKHDDKEKSAAVMIG